MNNTNQLFKNVTNLKNFINKKIANGEEYKIGAVMHNDMDGYTPEMLMRECPLLEGHCAFFHVGNVDMSSKIEDIVFNGGFDFVVICDISCDILVAAKIEASDKKDTTLLLDHHDTANWLNISPKWAIVQSEMIEDYRTPFYGDKVSEGHCSGTSLMFDYLEYCGLLNISVADKEWLKKLVFNVSSYDTWDWHDIFHNRDCFQLNKIFVNYGGEKFVRVYMNKMKHHSAIFGLKEKIVLKVSDVKFNSFIRPAILKEGTLSMKEGSFSVGYVQIDGYKYQADIFEFIERKFPNKQIYMLNYGKGLSLRAPKGGVHVGQLLDHYGGGGHQGAAGLKPRDKEGNEIFLSSTKEVEEVLSASFTSK